MLPSTIQSIEKTVKLEHYIFLTIVQKLSFINVVSKNPQWSSILASGSDYLAFTIKKQYDPLKWVNETMSLDPLGDGLTEYIINTVCGIDGSYKSVESVKLADGGFGYVMKGDATVDIRRKWFEAIYQGCSELANFIKTDVGYVDWSEQIESKNPIYVIRSYYKGEDIIYLGSTINLVLLNIRKHVSEHGCLELPKYITFKSKKFSSLNEILEEYNVSLSHLFDDEINTLRIL